MTGKDSSVEDETADERDSEERYEIMDGTEKVLENIGRYSSQ